MYIKYIGSLPTATVVPLRGRVVARDEPIDAPGDVAVELLKQRTWVECDAFGVQIVSAPPANDPPADDPPANDPPADAPETPETPEDPATEPEAERKPGRRKPSTES